jgi:hypothetical protein
MEIVNIQVNAEYLCTFTSFDNWVNKASSWIGGFPRNEKIICVDKNGNTLPDGKDFMHARDNDLFPVKGYRLIRSSEHVIPSEKISVHHIKCYNNAPYILVTGLPENAIFDITDKDDLPVALMVHQKNGHNVMPPYGIFPVNLHTKGRAVELLGLINGLNEKTIRKAYPLKTTTSVPDANIADQKYYVQVSKRFKTYKEAFIADIFHRYKITIDPKTTVLLKLK